MLSVKNITKKINHKTVVDNVSLSISTGQVFILLGQSGVGKSTILRLLAGLDEINSGAMLLDGQPLCARDVGMVFQDFNLFPHLTVIENLTLPLTCTQKMSEQEAQKIAHQALAQFNIDHKADVYPSSLSGGQKQRVAFARALCMNPKVLCLDEPTSALDPVLTADVAQIIIEIAQKNMVVVIATHDIGLVENLKTATVALMQNGIIVESARVEQVISSDDSFLKLKNFMQGKKPF